MFCQESDSYQKRRLNNRRKLSNKLEIRFEVWPSKQPFLSAPVFVQRRTARYSPSPCSIIAVVFSCMQPTSQHAGTPLQLPRTHHHSNHTCSDYTSLRRLFHPELSGADEQKAAVCCHFSQPANRVISAPAGTPCRRACCE